VVRLDPGAHSFGQHGGKQEIVALVNMISASPRPSVGSSRASFRAASVPANPAPTITKRFPLAIREFRFRSEILLPSQITYSANAAAALAILHARLICVLFNEVGLVRTP
jgi:hypothetical protein